MSEQVFDPEADTYDPYDLTEAQERVWRQMRYLQSVNGGRAVTQTELSKALGLKSKQGCTVHFVALANLGYIVCTKPRGEQRRAAWRSWVAVVPSTDRPKTPYLVGTRKARIEVAAAPTYTHPYGTQDGSPTLADGLTQRQIDVWAATMVLQTENYVTAVSQRSVSAALGMKSDQGVRAHFMRLIETGYMEHNYRKWFARRVIGDKNNPQFRYTFDAADPCESLSSTTPKVTLTPNASGDPLKDE
jgi:SOS-response transcriptional repressor LexA